MLGQDILVFILESHDILIGSIVYNTQDGCFCDEQMSTDDDSSMDDSNH